MKILYKEPKHFQVFTEWFYPLWIEHGFNWDLFPDLTVKINIPTTKSGLNYDRDHYDPNDNEIITRVITWDDFPPGVSQKDKEYIMELRESSLFHEISHHVHYEYFGSRSGNEKMDIWNKVFDLMGKPRPTKKDFEFVKMGENHYAHSAYEQFACYFNDVIRGRKENDEFVRYIREDILKIKPKPIEKPDTSKPKPSDTKPETLYRVRKSWSDVKSQKGAYKSLESAIELAQKHEGYSVYDSEGRVVYNEKTNNENDTLKIKIVELKSENEKLKERNEVLANNLELYKKQISDIKNIIK